jgi:peroxiredoxin
MKEMPALVEFVGEYQKKGVQVFGISVDERPEIMIPKTVVEFGLNFPNFADKGGKIAQFFQLHGVPLTVFYNKNRKILAVQPGDIDWLSVKMQKRIEQWISDPQNQ